jgi:hypothetical protein
MNISALRDLERRLEAASGPDQELDRAIMAMMFKREARHIGTYEDDGFKTTPVTDDVWVDPATDRWVSTCAREFTSSVDSALTVLPAGHDIALSPTFVNSGHGYRAQVYKLTRYAISPLPAAVAHSTTKPLAILLAIIRALISLHLPKDSLSCDVVHPGEPVIASGGAVAQGRDGGSK